MRACAPLLLIALLRLRGLRPTVDLTTGLQVQDVSTGWFDAGIVNGQNKLVPSITFSLKNVSNQKLVALQINALFRRVTEKDEWGSGFLTVAGSEGLAPGVATPGRSRSARSSATPAAISRARTCCGTAISSTPRSSCSRSTDPTQWKRIGEFP